MPAMRNAWITLLLVGIAGFAVAQTGVSDNRTDAITDPSNSAQVMSLLGEPLRPSAPSYETIESLALARADRLA